MGRVSEAVARTWGLEGHPREQAEAALYSVVLEASERAARRFPYLPSGVVEDRVARKAHKLWQWLLDGRVEPGREDGYVRSAIKKDLISYMESAEHRRTQGLEDRPVQAPATARPAFSEGMLKGARDHIARLKGNPGVALDWVYVQGRSPAELVYRELRHAVEQDELDPLGELEKARKTAEDRVNQWLSRGRARVEQDYLRSTVRLFEDAPPALEAVLRARFEQGVSRRKLPAHLGLDRDDADALHDRALDWLRMRLIEAEGA